MARSKQSSWKTRVVAAAVAAGAAILVPQTASPAPAACSFPGAAWKSAPAAAVGLDAAKLGDALDWATMHQSYSVLVIRHGCLAGLGVPFWAPQGCTPAGCN